MATIPPAFISLLTDTSLAAGWDQSVATHPGILPFLMPDAIQENGSWANLSAGAIDFATSAAGLIASNPDLTLLAWHMHRTLFIDKTIDPGSTRDWPQLTPILGDFGGVFYLIAMLSGIPGVRAFHKSRGVPDGISRDTCRDTYVWAKQYFDIGIFKDGRFYHPGQPGCWGLCTRIIPWLLSHLYGHLYRVGRLQYKTGPFRQPLCAYRNRNTGRIRLLAEAGQSFRADGNYNGAAGITDPQAWTSALSETDSEIIGNPIHPDGHARREPIALPCAEWEPILIQGDPILEIHIPEDGPMDFDACGKSLRDAAAFFPRHFPDRPFKAICCTSWFLDPTYQKLLSPRSNIVRFQRESHLFPLNARGRRSGLERIFGPHVHDLSTAPRNSSMRAAVLDHLEQGGALISGGGLLWPEYLVHWGAQVYLNQWRTP